MMLDRDGYPPGVPCWIDTSQPDPAAAIEFYGSLFGWEFVERAW
jgi:predicted enzyme related to lactoylglutathione lyase